jgi:hypothetical protein
MATKKAASKGAKKKAAKKKGAAKKRPPAKKSAKKSTKKSSAKKAVAIKGVVGRCTGWQAVQDNMPPGPPKLTVTGRCRFPTGGYKVTLKEAVPQGINPAILLLRKTVRRPTGNVIQVLTTVRVRYVKKNSTFKYTHVTILPEGTTVKVQQVF